MIVEPWIGANYGASEIFPYKTLVLGESNYTDVQASGQHKNLKDNTDEGSTNESGY